TVGSLVQCHGGPQESVGAGGRFEIFGSDPPTFSDSHEQAFHVPAQGDRQLAGLRRAASDRHRTQAGSGFLASLRGDQRNPSRGCVEEVATLFAASATEYFVSVSRHQAPVFTKLSWFDRV